LRDDDDLAQRFLTPSIRAALRIPALRRFAVGWFARRLPGVFGIQVARCRWGDAHWSAAAAAGTEQFVVMGAGYDTRGFRLRRPGARVFEIDHPATAARKQRVAPSHPSLAYVAASLDEDGWPERLWDAGLRADADVHVTLEGLLYYLPKARVRDILRHLAPRSARGSLTLDMIDDRAYVGAPDRHGAPELVAYLRRHGEPYRSFARPFEMLELLRDSGWTVTEHLDPDAILARYGCHGGRLALPILGGYHFYAAQSR